MNRLPHGNPGEPCMITIIDKTPEQMNLSFALWTRQAISDLAKRHYGITLSLRTVINHFKRWDFTCQRPTKKVF
jgi:transposase